MPGKVLSTTKYDLHGSDIVENSDYVRSVQTVL